MVDITLHHSVWTQPSCLVLSIDSIIKMCTCHMVLCSLTWNPLPCTASLEWKRSFTLLPPEMMGWGSCFPHFLPSGSHCVGPWGSLCSACDTCMEGWKLSFTSKCNHPFLFTALPYSVRHIHDWIIVTSRVSGRLKFCTRTVWLRCWTFKSFWEVPGCPFILKITPRVQQA